VVPEETARVARAAFPKGNVYVKMRDLLGSIDEDAQFSDRFAPRGRPVEAPWRLALVTVMQFAEGLSDRQAAEAVRARSDWKDALGLELTDPGVDFSRLCEFRARLVAGSAEHRLVDALVEACAAHGYLKARGRQRTDSTHVLGALRVLSRLERVAETLRAALNALAVAAPDWLQAPMAPEWAERSGRRIEEYRLPRGQEARLAYAAPVGEDGQQRLAGVDAQASPESIQTLPEVALLRQVWAQEYDLAAGGPLRLRDPKARPAAAQAIESPDDPQARYAPKRDIHGVGYTGHLTQTCAAGLPHLLTPVTTTLATTPDVVELPRIQDALAEHGRLPAQQRVDAGYTRASNLVSSRQRHQVALVGPVDTDHQWQTKVQDGFTTERFAIDWERQPATCPAGQTRIRWCETHTARQRTMLHMDCAAADCLVCPARARCTRATTGPGARSLTLQPHAEYMAVLAGRARQRTPEFATLYAQRAGIEGTLSQGVRAFGLRRARYRGRAKTILTDYPCGADCTPLG
jgi:transposase